MAITETLSYGAAWFAVAASAGMVLRTIGRIRDVGSALAATSLAFEILFGAGVLGVATHFLRTGEPLPIAWLGGSPATASANAGAGSTGAGPIGAAASNGATATPGWPSPVAWPAGAGTAIGTAAATATGRPCATAGTDAGHGVVICLAP